MELVTDKDLPYMQKQIDTLMTQLESLDDLCDGYVGRVIQLEAAIVAMAVEFAQS
jgi:hypothetical protein